MTDADLAGRWRELLDGTGVKRASVCGSGIFSDAASDATVRGIFFDAVDPRWQLIVPGFGTLSGAFQVTALEYAGEHNGEVTYEIALELAGAIAFAAACARAVLRPVLPP